MKALPALLLASLAVVLPAPAAASHDCVLAWGDLGIRRVGCVEDGIVHLDVESRGRALAWGDVGIRREGCVEEDLPGPLA